MSDGFVCHCGPCDELCICANCDREFCALEPDCYHGDKGAFCGECQRAIRPLIAPFPQAEPCKHRNSRVVDYDPMWRDGTVICLDCGFSRMYDAG
jgi:hypothetical protein